MSAASAMAAHIAQDRLDRLKEHADCEKRYGDLSAEQNLQLSGKMYGMPRALREERIERSHR